MQCFGSGPIWVFFKGSRSTSLECAVRCVQFRPIKWKKKLRRGTAVTLAVECYQEKMKKIFLSFYQKIPEIIPANLKNHFLVEFL